MTYAGGKYTGDVRISGHPKEQASFARVSGYVEQFDIVSLCLQSVLPSACRHSERLGIRLELDCKSGSIGFVSYRLDTHDCHQSQSDRRIASLHTQSQVLRSPQRAYATSQQQGVHALWLHF